MIYLDNNATSPIDPEVYDAMLPYLREEYGNPSSKYYLKAENAYKAVEHAREQVAMLISANPDEIIFTSGSTEANNFVIKGVADYYRSKGNQFITSPVEHKSVLETYKYLQSRNFNCTYLPVNSKGQVSTNDLQSVITDQTLLVSIIWGNNEIGSLNDIESLAQVCASKLVFFHSDATQVLGKIPINLNKSLVNFLSISAHKVYGPKGVGACYIRKSKLGLKTKLTPLLHGGSQEFGYRSGTLAVHNIVGFGKACEIAQRDLKRVASNMIELEEILLEALMSVYPNLTYNHHEKEKIPGVMSITFPGIHNELLVRQLAKEDVAVSTGSACSSAEPSHVLSSIGVSPDQIRSTIRISFNKWTSSEEIKKLITALTHIIARFPVPSKHN